MSTFEIFLNFMRSLVGSSCSSARNSVLVALKRDRHKLDSARIVKDDSEADQAADSLTRTCAQVAALFEHHHHMWLVGVFFFSIE